MMDILKMGKDLLSDKMGGDSSGIMEALTKITSGEGLDLGGIAEKLKAGGLSDQVSSWMGDGENESVSGDQITNALGAEKVNEMATKMGVDSSTAADKLSQAMPALMDKMSSGGSLLDGLGGGGGLMDKAKSLFK